MKIKKKNLGWGERCERKSEGGGGGGGGCGRVRFFVKIHLKKIQSRGGGGGGGGVEEVGSVGRVGGSSRGGMVNVNYIILVFSQSA